MKKTALLIILFILSVCTPAFSAENSYNIQVMVNGTALSFPDQKPFLEYDRIYVPLRIVSEALGAEVNWEEATQTTILKKNKIIVTMPIGSTSAVVNGRPKAMDAPARMVDERIVVPLRFISECLGAQIDWSSAPNSIVVNVKLSKIFGYSNEQVKWALATSALLIKVNDMKFDTLGGALPSEAYIESEKRVLSNWWGINSREDVFKIFDWLKKEGHSYSYNQLDNEISNLTKDRYAQLLDFYAGDDRMLKKITFVREHHQELKGKSLTGWDLCRLVSVAGMSYIAGYISYEEALAEIMPAAKILQKTFSSWKDMGTNYLLGRQYWSGKEEQEFSEALKWLGTNPESPWLKYDWNLSLKKNRAYIVIRNSFLLV